ncbi:hypothetical protein EYF80_062370 [Liparis tanakae]|uniref:Uncharacterized protein n=1 Tax=Liparis tanakae TaxID=230148 RepID=A0A4Z2EF27_9TELE|nr:hypothetical protein EYF80_062370 [Liparis tanakae]
MDARELKTKLMSLSHFQPDGGMLFTKLLAYLDESSFSGAPSARGRQAGQENVQSRTSAAAAEVTVQKKAATQSVEEVAEVQGWIKDVAPPPAALVYEKPHKKTMHAPELQLDVKAGGKKAEEDVFGYVITDTELRDSSSSRVVAEYLVT